MIFSQFNKRTLTAVVKYQCSFTPQDQNLTQICIDFILDNDALLYEVDAQAVCISNSDDLDDDCQIMNWPVPGDDKTPSWMCSASASTEFASVKPPPSLDKSLLESTRVSPTPTAHSNAALSSAEKAYSVLENCTVDKRNNSINNTNKTSSSVTEIDKQFSPIKTQNMVTVYESSLDELPKINMKFRKVEVPYNPFNRNSDSRQNHSPVTSIFITDDTPISSTCNSYKASKPCTSASLTPVMSSPDKIKGTQFSHVKQLIPTECNQGPMTSSKQSTSFTDFINKVVKDAKATPDKMKNIQHRNSSLGGILGHNATLPSSSTKTSASSLVTDTHEQNNICINNRLNDYITNNNKQAVPNSQSLPNVINVERLNSNFSKNTALKPVSTSTKNNLLPPSISQNNLLRPSINGVVADSSVLKPSICSSTVTSSVLKANITNVNSMIKDNTDNGIGNAIKPATAGSGATVPNIINVESFMIPPIITVRATHTLTSTVTTPKSNSSAISNTLSVPSNSSTIRSTTSPITRATPSTINMSANNKQVEEVLQLFEDADPDYVDRLLLAHAGPTAVNNVCAALLDNPDYPKKQVIMITDLPTTHTPPKSESTIDYYKDYPKQINYDYMDEVNKQLQNDFPIVSVRDINNIMKFYNNYYAPSYRSIFNAVQAAYADQSKSGKRIEELNISMVDNAGVERSIKSRLLKCKRGAKSVRMTKQLQMEMDFIANMNKKEKLDADAQLAMKLNEDQYEEAGESIECLCCYGEHPFENMVQCFDGHLFCKTCLQSYVKEAVFGSGKLDLSCMTDGCDSSFPGSQLELCLAQDVLEKYQDRVREENLNLADIEDLVRCPGCDFAAILDPGDKVFRCQNIHCLKETCRFCKEEWKDHIGIPCSELEKKDETTLRKEYEEKMTAAKVRTCLKCKSQFMKDEGCNKMTCRCGASMCYICRKPDISYNHFCQHPRDPGHNCSKCTACSLWSNPEEDDKRAVLEIQHEAQLKRKEKGFLEDKVVGAPDEPPSKRARTS
ncbi:hypothetical protein SNE40_019051 [Patella caerulea]